MTKKLATSKAPNSYSKAAEKIKEIISLGWVDIPDASSYRGHGTAGRMIEFLLDLKENNNDSPDLFDWEIKTHGGGPSLITLFHKEPEPQGIMNQMVHAYGWDDDKGRVSFRVTIEGKHKRGFYVTNEPDRVSVRHNGRDILAVPFWTHNVLLGAAGAKLRRLILVDCEINKTKKQIRYTGATAYWEFNLTGFCDACEKGIVWIDFDARTSKGRGTALRNHGTKFRIKLSDIHLLYQNSRKIT